MNIFSRNFITDYNCGSDAVVQCTTANLVTSRHYIRPLYYICYNMYHKSPIFVRKARCLSKLSTFVRKCDFYWKSPPCVSEKSSHNGGIFPSTEICCKTVVVLLYALQGAKRFYSPTNSILVTFSEFFFTSLQYQEEDEGMD
jgi:hypothetical protein